MRALGDPQLGETRIDVLAATVNENDLLARRSCRGDVREGFDATDHVVEERST
jgi:hypothetical protein